MDYQEKLSKISEKYDQLKVRFSKEDVAFIANKDTPRGRLLGFLTTDYYRRENLIREGTIVYGYTFRTHKTTDSMDRLYASWLLFSPSKAVNDDVNIYLKIIDNLDSLKEKKHPSSIERKLQIALGGELSEPKYLEVPAPYNEGYLIYLQYCEVKPNHTPNLELGPNYIIIAPSKSKEVIYLPERYFFDVIPN